MFSIAFSVEKNKRFRYDRQFKMEDAFKIYVEQLRDGHVEKLNESYEPAFLEIDEKDVSFMDPVLVKGEAYLAEDELILHLSIETKVILPCIVCNDRVKVPVLIQNAIQAVPLSEIKGGVLNMKELLREVILLDTPAFAECEGKCPRRKEIAKYLKETEGKQQPNEEDGFTPFADLKWDKDV